MMSVLFKKKTNPTENVFLVVLAIVANGVVLGSFPIHDK